MKLKNLIAASLLLSTITTSAFASTYHVCKNLQLGLEMMISSQSDYDILEKAEKVKLDIALVGTFDAKIDHSFDITRLSGDGFSVMLTKNFGSDTFNDKKFNVRINGVIGNSSLPGLWRCKEVYASSYSLYW